MDDITVANESAGCQRRRDVDSQSTAGKAVNIKDVEYVLQGIYSEVLQLDSIDATDNFVLLGGDSLTAMSVLWRINQRLRCQLSIHVVMTRTIEDLALEIGRQ